MKDDSETLKHLNEVRKKERMTEGSERERVRERERTRVT